MLRLSQKLYQHTLLRQSGVYAATAGPLLPGAYVILGRATAPGLDRLTTASAWIVETDLDLALTASSQTVRPDDLLTYTFTITNQGPSDAYSLALSTTLPSTMQFVSLQATRSGCILAGRLVTCSLGLGSAEQAEVRLVVRPTLPGLLTLTAQVSTLERELVLENNIRSLSVMVTPWQCFLPLLQR